MYSNILGAWSPCASHASAQFGKRLCGGEQGPLERLQTALSFLCLDEDAPSPSAGGSSIEEQARARVPARSPPQAAPGRPPRPCRTQASLWSLLAVLWLCGALSMQHGASGIRGAAGDWRPCVALERPIQAEQRTRLRAAGALQ